jgi:hypothetical protein
MSHFTVLVIGGDVEKQLAPFQENNMGDCPSKFMRYYIYDNNGDQVWFDDEKQAVESGIERDPDDSEGRWENPNAKWDWFQIGGRWTGFFKLTKAAMTSIENFFGDGGTNESDAEVARSVKVGEASFMVSAAERGYCDQARRCDVDWESMREEKKQDAIESWTEFEADENAKDNPATMYFKYGINKGETRDDYLHRRTSSAGITHAVIKDGQWYEQGEMGWFGCVSDEKENDVWNSEFAKLIESLPADTLITIVDCHI